MLEVAVREADEPPEQREYQPAEHEGQHEVEQIPAPFDVDQRREYIRHVPLPTLLDVGSIASFLAFLSVTFYRSFPVPHVSQFR